MLYHPPRESLRERRCYPDTEYECTHCDDTEHSHELPLPYRPHTIESIETETYDEYPCHIPQRREEVHIGIVVGISLSPESIEEYIRSPDIEWCKCLRLECFEVGRGKCRNRINSILYSKE